MTTESSMSRLRRHTVTVRFRITVLAALVAFVVLTVASAGLVITQRQLLLRNLDNALRQRTDDLADLLAADRLPVRLGAIGDDTAAQIVTLDGVVVAASPNLAGETVPIAESPRAAGSGDTRTIRDLPVDDDPFRLLSRRIDTAEGPLVTHVASGLDDIGESTGVLRTSLTVAVPAVTALLALLVWWLVGRTLRPVEAIRAEVADIGGSDLGRRVPEPPGDDEIARLARTMNQMLDRVEHVAERQQRFVADASHELRSPLTRIRAEVEVDLAHPHNADLPATHRSVLEEIVALQRLVDDLLALARSDAGRTVAAHDVVDLDDIVMEQARRARAAERVAVDTSGVTAAQVRGERGALERAVGNLVDNAARYASRAVTLTLASLDGRAVLSVADDGPGIPHDEHERVFERFARADDARSGRTGGTGLGLAIARDVARRHGGDITIDSDHAPGARLVMTVPVLSAGDRPAH